jgi:acyl-CoA thioesterase I
MGSTRLGKGEPVNGLAAVAIAIALMIATPVEAMTLKIVAIGASNTWGLGVGWNSAYPAVLQALLRKKGIDANVTNSGVLLDRTGWMLRRLDADVPEGTHIVILQPGANDLRFFGNKEQRAANIAAMLKRLQKRGIRVIVYDPDPLPPDAYQWDRIHFNAEAHAKIAARLAVQIMAPANPQAAGSPEIITRY